MPSMSSGHSPRSHCLKLPVTITTMLELSAGCVQFSPAFIDGVTSEAVNRSVCGLHSGDCPLRTFHRKHRPRRCNQLGYLCVCCVLAYHQVPTKDDLGASAAGGLSVFLDWMLLHLSFDKIERASRQSRVYQ